ncbi:3-oxoacyl-[acyl-carrier protein] reductase [Bacillus sp. JCM 19046]|uniref:NAD(P)-dependent dehydrogenase (Short-subunit alcohol dehydrogenase family) n=1 Tax=Shouchella xiaoxiensis TaxID=766895 RepID=A0ABS2STH4_9BACI|nr:glucose 1-dehydrogenase [Shouchella xiaoxiensis]MBM7838813.1 NAD(P)-dependent dehydrogenase (short-subunit alcohol dehydrogenase family) [Shouchella xiaoxiensis]GAF15092.1 3-oxoacyl-[acyl-carrier protein] reductase [Bacillus sp. JCM 19045]GAF19963.1 3-oxoacyl-[acyl-carrier protein] reductase [Bacillus sp. JCM 19046]
MKKRFEEKVILLTGGGSGLGHAAAMQLAKEGATLSLVDLNEESLEKVANEIKKEVPDVKILTLTADVSDEEAVKSFVQETKQQFGKIDGFFNNAGIEGKQNETQNYGIDEFRKVVDINLNGVFFGMKYVLEVMKEQGSGSIVNTASVGGIRGVGNQSGYAASKHGVVGLTKNSGIEYGQYGISINAIAPGAILTAMVEGSLKQMGGDDWEATGEEFVKANPMKRFGKPEEVGHLVAFLLSDESNFINAAVIPIDGGQSNKY